MEGPSLVIATEELAMFKGKVVKDLVGNTKIDKDKMCNKAIKNILSWGKHLIFEFDTFSISVHFLMYGSYRVNEKKPDTPSRLSMIFDNGELNFYNCSIKILEDIDIYKLYDWEVDIMSKTWNPEKAFLHIQESKDEMLCDILMDQGIFAGVGNIIKNEALFNTRLHPEAVKKDLSIDRIKQLIHQAREYSLQFYEWKKEYSLKKHWQIFRKKICPRDNVPITRKKTGRLERWSYFCDICQYKH